MKYDKVEPIIEDDRMVGVKIPIINKAIYFADIKENRNWGDAVEYAKSLGKKIPTYRELCILAYFREEIEEICPKFKDAKYIWGEQYSADIAWYLANYGSLDTFNKYYDFTVVPLADLPEQPQLTEFEKEEKELLLKDLCARLPYGVQVSINDKIITTLKNLKVTHFYNDTNTVQDTFVQVDISDGNDFVKITSIKPYLRPMLSMTEEEKLEYQSLCKGMLMIGTTYELIDTIESIDWLNSHHFDFRNLIEKGLAIDCTNLDIY